MQPVECIPIQRHCSDEGRPTPPMPQLPDGIGLTLEQVREQLAVQHQAVVAKDDPLLMLVTLLNAFLTEEDKLLNRHNQALTQILSARTDGYLQAVEKSTATLGESLSSASLDGVAKMFGLHGHKMERFQANMNWLAAIAGISALVNVAVFAALALR